MRPLAKFMPSKEYLKQFNKFYLKHYGEQLSEQENLERAVRVLNLVKIVNNRNSDWLGLINS